MIYYEVLQNRDEAGRNDVNSILNVNEWETPVSYVRVTTPKEDIPEGAPSWWKGDAEASQSFMREMGVS